MTTPTVSLHFTVQQGATFRPAWKRYQVPAEAIVQIEGRQHFWHEGRHIGLVAASQLLNRPPSQAAEQAIKVVVIRERDTLYGVAVERLIGERVHDLVGIVNGIDRLAQVRAALGI